MEDLSDDPFAFMLAMQCEVERVQVDGQVYADELGMQTNKPLDHAREVDIDHNQLECEHHARRSPC